ncbi:MAG: regulatory iron-sulfur-containing complex subunit RicT [Acidobacteriota bacterium]
MIEIITVKFRQDKRVLEFLSHDVDLRIGDYCVVATERGVELGMVVRGRHADNLGENRLQKVLRKATERDLYLNEKKQEKEELAFRMCRKRIQARDLPMKLSKVEYLFDGSRVIFYFTADHRVDFRELVKDLARELRTRIEMRQIGARDEARLVGGLGNCGLGENCSKKFLKELSSVSVKTVKRQGLGMNLNRLSGMCGRLKCCLNFAASEDLDPSSRGGNCSDQCG